MLGESAVRQGLGRFLLGPVPPRRRDEESRRTTGPVPVCPDTPPVARRGTIEAGAFTGSRDSRKIHTIPLTWCLFRQVSLDSWISGVTPVFLVSRCQGRTQRPESRCLREPRSLIEVVTPRVPQVVQLCPGWSLGLLWSSVYRRDLFRGRVHQNYLGRATGSRFPCHGYMCVPTVRHPL